MLATNKWPESKLIAYIAHPVAHHDPSAHWIAKHNAHTSPQGCFRSRRILIRSLILSYLYFWGHCLIHLFIVCWANHKLCLEGDILSPSLCTMISGIFKNSDVRQQQANEAAEYSPLDNSSLTTEERCHLVAVDWEGVCDHSFDHVLTNSEISLARCGPPGASHISQVRVARKVL